MNNLITINETAIGQDTVQTVDARELHAFLESKQDFSTWIKNRIEQYEFQENQDYFCSTNLWSKNRGGHNRIDYTLTLDMAKELSMVEKNERGKEARRYFIECERLAKQAAKNGQQVPSIAPATLTLSSREIAKLCCKRHDRVAKDIERMLLVLKRDLSLFARLYTTNKNTKQTEYLLPKRECLILVSGYSTVLRAKIVDRWLELEQANQPQLQLTQEDDTVYRLPEDRTKIPLRIRDCINKHAQQLAALYRLEAEAYLLEQVYRGAVGMWREISFSKVEERLKKVLWLDVVDKELAEMRSAHYLLFRALRDMITRDVKKLEELHLSAPNERLLVA
ncbi:antA/AntB antirepressor family protein [Bartonella sp. DGB2]|uniref:antA/AntB antirepressor family protein n=1 Tax=Bartonella sp. DGB2 TaxID=3388426 RepID=UPI0039901D62